mmetsp:Transcript_46413/g.120057  ORF Transcript_46413/g.120057 Transcript_46413/m.120057 type:complete len:373 (+) Transcript_46413:147-1265(+)
MYATSCMATLSTNVMPMPSARTSELATARFPACEPSRSSRCQKISPALRRSMAATDGEVGLCDQEVGEAPKAGERAWRLLWGDLGQFLLGVLPGSMSPRLRPPGVRVRRSLRPVGDNPKLFVGVDIDLGLWGVCGLDVYTCVTRRWERQSGNDGECDGDPGVLLTLLVGEPPMYASRRLTGRDGGSHVRVQVGGLPMSIPSRRRIGRAVVTRRLRRRMASAATTSASWMMTRRGRSLSTCTCSGPARTSCGCSMSMVWAWLPYSSAIIGSSTLRRTSQRASLPPMSPSGTKCTFSPEMRCVGMPSISLPSLCVCTTTHSKLLLFSNKYGLPSWAYGLSSTKRKSEMGSRDTSTVVISKTDVIPRPPRLRCRK